MAGGPETTRLRLTARQWATIDAVIDNVISNEIAEGDPNAVRVGQAIRQAGRDQVPWVGGQWPPMASSICITLTCEQWRFAQERARAGIEIAQQIG